MNAFETPQGAVESQEFLGCRQITSSDLVKLGKEISEQCVKTIFGCRMGNPAQFIVQSGPEFVVTIQVLPDGRVLTSPQPMLEMNDIIRMMLCHPDTEVRLALHKVLFG